MNKTDGKILTPGKITILSCFGIQAVGIGVYIAFGVFFNPLMEEFGWSRAVISGASSTAFFISGLFAILVGRLNDRTGPRLIMTVTAVFFGTGLILMSFADSIWQLYLFFGCIFGIGLSAVDVIALTTIARWFPLKRGRITGIVKVGTGAGQFFFPFLASILITGFGWRSAYLVLGLLSMAVLCMIARLLKKEPGQAMEDPPSKIEPDRSRDPALVSELTFSQAAGTGQLWLLCLVTFTIVSCLMSTLVHIVPYGRDIGVGAHKAAGVLSAIGAVSMAGRFATGIIIDRIGSKRSMLMALFVLLIGFTWLQFSHSLWHLYVFACIYGLAHGGFFTVVSPIVAELFGTAYHGSLFGLVVFFGTAGGAIGPFFAGYLFDVSGSYSLPFGLMLVISCLGSVLLFLLKPVRA